jgi:adenylosuccinate synthase
VPATVLIGGFFGDEGKGKIISYLSLKDKPSIVVRGGVGPNAFHEVNIEDRKYKVRMIPSGFVNKNSKLMIGPGVLINPDIFLKEVEDLKVSDRVFLDKNCGIIEESHRLEDNRGHLKDTIVTTGTGTGPANASRASRTLKLARDFDSLKKYLDDVPLEINSALDRKENVLVEGTQGTHLSLWHGTYPFVTSKDVTASGICADVGLGPKKVDEVMVIFKSFVTRSPVTGGILENELDPEEIHKRQWVELGPIWGRLRRAAEFNFELAKRSIMLNGATQIALTKLDTLFPDSANKTEYDSLDDNAKSFITKVEKELKVPVTLIGTGPDVNDTIDRREN